jgi:hypothetical protein
MVHVGLLFGTEIWMQFNHANAHTHTHTHTHTQHAVSWNICVRNVLTNAGTEYRFSDSYVCIYELWVRRQTDSLSLSLSLTHTHTHTHSLSLSIYLSLSHTHTHTHALLILMHRGLLTPPSLTTNICPLCFLHSYVSSICHDMCIIFISLSLSFSFLSLSLSLTHTHNRLPPLSP